MIDNDTIDAGTPSHHQRFAVDEQTGKVYELKKENRVDYVFAIVSIIYLLLVMAFFFWLLFDVWIGQYRLATVFGYPTELLSSPAFRLPAYAFIGGALGGTVNGIRSFLVWHAERFAFGQRFIWKYVTAPWLGAALALFTFALIRSGVVVFNGDNAPDVASFSQVLATFGIGVLAGYGSREVFIWLDAQVKRLFQVQPSANVIVPELIGKTRQEAEDILRAVRLNLGDVVEQDQDEPGLAGKVISQTPPPNTPLAGSGSVNIIIGRLAATETPDQ
ncbi:MAG: hypothetical protein FOGNACKC_00725 [Anaerolineae bacterium]|nr:hypothetical protein [Anaerolineae bacterium]